MRKLDWLGPQLGASKGSLKTSLPPKPWSELPLSLSTASSLPASAASFPILSEITVVGRLLEGRVGSLNSLKGARSGLVPSFSLETEPYL